MSFESDSEPNKSESERNRATNGGEELPEIDSCEIEATKKSCSLSLLFSINKNNSTTSTEKIKEKQETKLYIEENS